MMSGDIFRLLLIILLLTNDKDESGEYSSINQVVIIAMLLSSCSTNNRLSGCGNSASPALSGSDGCGCNNGCSTGGYSF